MPVYIYIYIIYTDIHMGGKNKKWTNANILFLNSWLTCEYMSHPATWSRRFLITRRSCKSGWLCKRASSFSGTRWCSLEQTSAAIFGVDELAWKVDATTIQLWILFISTSCWYQGHRSGWDGRFQIEGEHPVLGWAISGAYFSLKVP